MAVSSSGRWISSVVGADFETVRANVEVRLDDCRAEHGGCAIAGVPAAVGDSQQHLGFEVATGGGRLRELPIARIAPDV